MNRTRETHERIKAEILREKVAALGRAGERLETALDRVAALARRLAASGDPEERAPLLGDYDDEPPRRP